MQLEETAENAENAKNEEKADWKSNRTNRTLNPEVWHLSTYAQPEIVLFAFFAFSAVN